MNKKNVMVVLVHYVRKRTSSVCMDYPTYL